MILIRTGRNISEGLYWDGESGSEPLVRTLPLNFETPADEIDLYAMFTYKGIPCMLCKSAAVPKDKTCW